MKSNVKTTNKLNFDRKNAPYMPCVEVIVDMLYNFVDEDFDMSAVMTKFPL